MPYTATIERIRGEYLEMPGLRLTLPQAQRLCGVERALCEAVLNTLVETKFLAVSPNGVYARLSDGEPSRRRMAKMDSHPSALSGAA